MHYANIENSPRLKRFIGFLDDGQWRTTREIVMGAEVMAVNSCAAEVRMNGIAVECECIGKGRYRYRLPCMAHKVNGGQLSPAPATLASVCGSSLAALPDSA